MVKKSLIRRYFLAGGGIGGHPSIPMTLPEVSQLPHENGPWVEDEISLKLTASSLLKMDGWNTTFLLGWPIFRCYVSCRHIFQTAWNYPRFELVFFETTHELVTWISKTINSIVVL